MTDTTRIIDEIRAALDDEAIACFPDFTAAVRALLDHITAQAEEIERVSDLLTAAVDDYNGALARVRELEGALKPFEDIADTDEEVGRCDPEDGRVLIVQAHGCQLAELDIEDFRAVRTILTGEQQ